MVRSDQEIYALVGEAVCASQYFETAFVLATKLALKQRDARTLEDVVPVSESKDFKQPIAAIVNQLKKHGDVPLEERIGLLLESRHIIVHRLTREYVWPPQSKDEDEVIKRCRFVIAESEKLTGEFMKILISWMESKPGGEDFAKYRAYAEALAR